jgi:NitT/TauT family transport system substrate-binding protein
MNRFTALSLLGGIVATASRPAGAQGLPQVRTVATALDQSGALYYAHDLGIFTKHGLDVTITTPNDNALAVPSVVSNAVDIAYTNILAIEQAFRKGLPITMVAPAAVNDARWPNNYLLVPKDSPIKTPLDLQGKTLGTSPLKNLGDTCTNAWVEQHGGDGSKLKWVEIPYIACGEAMATGRIDGAFIALILEKYAKVDADTLAHMTRSIYAETIVPAELQPTIDFAAKYKFLDQAFPASDLIWKA